MKEFILDRSKWLVPETSGGHASNLCVTSVDKQCCLGLYATANGLSKEAIAGLPTPRSAVLSPRNQSILSSVREVFAPFLVTDGSEIRHTKPCTALIRLNDTSVGTQYVNSLNEVQLLSTQEYKESQMALEFEKLGIKVEFVGELDIPAKDE